MRVLDFTGIHKLSDRDFHHLESLRWIEQANDPVLALGRIYPQGFISPPHSHNRVQLWFAREGIVMVTACARHWMIPPGHALIIPAGIEHAAETITRVDMQSIYVNTLTENRALPRVVEVTPLARTLIEELVAVDHDEARSHRLALVTNLLLDEFTQLQERPLGLPLPTDRRLADLCRRFLHTPSATASIDQWAQEAGISRRSFTRLFRSQTGISFATWRQQACLFASLPRLAAGEPVTNVALDAGYENIAAFSTMFRRMLGRPPSAYFKAR